MGRRAGALSRRRSWRERAARPQRSARTGEQSRQGARGGGSRSLVRARSLLPCASVVSADAALEVPPRHVDLVSAAARTTNRGGALQSFPVARRGAAGDDERRLAWVA